MSIVNADAIKRVCVFRALQIGDMLCAVPALRALRTALPQARITLVGLPWARDFVSRFHRYIDDFICFPGAVGLPEQNPAAPAAAETFYRCMTDGEFDLALQMHGDGRLSNEIVARFGARLAVGFCPSETGCLSEGRFIPYPVGDPEIRRLLRLISFLGLPLCGEELEFPITTEEQQRAEQLLQEHGLRRHAYVCIHPGARAAARRWFPERFAAVADNLAKRGLRVVLSGSADELELTRRVAKTMCSPSLNVVGVLTLGEMAALFAAARLLICNDTGVSHMAAALHVPSVVVFTGSSPQRWAPLDSVRHRVVSVSVPCRPCTHTECPIGHSCADGVTGGAVIRESNFLIG